MGLGSGPGSWHRRPFSTNVLRKAQDEGNGWRNHHDHAKSISYTTVSFSAVEGRPWARAPLCCIRFSASPQSFDNLSLPKGEDERCQASGGPFAGRAAPQSAAGKRDKDERDKYFQKWENCEIVISDLATS